MTKEERQRILNNRRSHAAQNAANALIHQLDLRITKAVSDREYDDEFYDVLLEFKDDFIRKLLEKKPPRLLCKASEAFFQGLRGIEKLAPYFPSNLSMRFDWQAGHAVMIYF